MATRRNALIEKFFTCLISGDRPGARAIIDEAISADCPAEKILSNLFWPALEHVQSMHKNDQLGALGYNYATRLLRQLVDQMQMRLEQKERNGQRVLLVSGNEQTEEVAAQMAADLLEAEGYTVYYCGGGIANDEVVEQIGAIQAHKLVVFGATPQTVPYTRLLIDRLHELGSTPNLQICVGGGVFNRAEGLAEEIGADLWAYDPIDLVDSFEREGDRRMTADQRTVGRKRSAAGRAAA